MSAARVSKPKAALRLFVSELALVVSRRRNQVGVAILAAIPVLMAIAIRVSSPSGERGPDFISDISQNGYFVAVSALTVELTMFLPVAIAALCGDAISGEANTGTLRYLLTVPVGRTRLLATKYAALLVGCVVAPLTVALAGLLSGWLIFGIRPIQTLSGTELSVGDGLLRLLLLVGYLALCLASLAALGLFISTLTEQPIAATLATAGVVMLSWILSAIPQLDWLHPWLIVTHWNAGTDLLRTPIYWEGTQSGIWLALGYLLVFLTAAWARFGSKDITS